MSEAMLDLRGVEKGYNRGKPSEVIVLRGVDLTVARGEVVALVAPSGAGKSTLLHIAGLLDTADAGSVTLAGREMTGLSDRARTEARRAEVGFIYQFHHLLPEFSALENVVIPQLANGTPKAEAEARAQGPSGPGRRRRAGRSPPGGAVGGRAAARGLLPGAGECTEALAGGRADGQSGPGHLGPGVRGADGACAVNRPVGADRHA